MKKIAVVVVVDDGIGRNSRMQFSHTTWPVSENRDEARQQHRDLCDIACNLIGKPHEYSDGQRTHYGLIVHTYVRVE